MSLELRGTEHLTWEIEGRLAPAHARPRAPATLELERDEGGVVVSLLAFDMLGLRPAARLPGLSYREALWRIGVRLRGELAWFGVACDLDRRLVAAFGRWMVRYPVRHAAIELAEDSLRVAFGEQLLSFGARPLAVEDPPPVPPRPLLVADRGRLYRIPWREEPAPRRWFAAIDPREHSLASATLGPVRWSARALLQRGRIHRCGLAAAIDSQTLPPQRETP